MRYFTTVADRYVCSISYVLGLFKYEDVKGIDENLLIQFKVIQVNSESL